MKKYENPMLQVVSIKKNDIITDSAPLDSGSQDNDKALAPGQRGLDFNSWYEGY